MKQDAESVGHPKYYLGQIVVADLSLDKVVGYVIEVQNFSDGKFSGWYKIHDFHSGKMEPQFEAKEEWLETYEEFSDRRHSKI
jgi:hypothetical protein